MENIAAVIAGAVEHIPRKWANVQVRHRYQLPNQKRFAAYQHVHWHLMV